MLSETPGGYSVRLDRFEGPLDLLLHLIRKNELNIHDIPIALITRQYLEYLDLMKSLNLVIAGEFLVMAATLISIKARTLLPQEVIPEEEGPDPREELVRRLLEYRTVQEAAAGLAERERIWSERFRRDPNLPEIDPAEPAVEPEASALIEASLFDLLDSLRAMLERIPTGAGIELRLDEPTVTDRIAGLLEQVQQAEQITFAQLCGETPTRAWVIVTFLALLELVRLRLVSIFQTELCGEVRIRRAENAAEEEPIGLG